MQEKSNSGSGEASAERMADQREQQTQGRVRRNSVTQSEAFFALVET